MVNTLAMAEHNELGIIGETIARLFLVKQGFSILDTNFRGKHGEIDIVAEKDKIIHFVEVKSVKVKDVTFIENLVIRPEDNLTPSKYAKLKTTIELYVYLKKIREGIAYQLDLACVYINLEKRESRVKLLSNVIVE